MNETVRKIAFDFLCLAEDMINIGDKIMKDVDKCSGINLTELDVDKIKVFKSTIDKVLIYNHKNGGKVNEH